MRYLCSVCGSCLQPTLASTTASHGDEHQPSRLIMCQVSLHGVLLLCTQHCSVQAMRQH